MADNDGFRKYLIEHTGISADEAENMVSSLHEKEIEKGAFLLREGDVCKNIFFVEKGLLRVYTVDQGGKEHIIQFAPENWWFSDRGSLYFDEPSSFFVEAVENSKVLLLDADFFNTPGMASQVISHFNDRLLNNHIRHLQRRINMLLSATAEQRYLDFIEVYPDITLRVPQWMIASYLGITPEGLSRVRKELARQNQS